MVRRAALGMLALSRAEAIASACEILAASAGRGGPTSEEEDRVGLLLARLDPQSSPGSDALVRALRFAVQAARAAWADRDRGADEEVTEATWDAVRALGEDPRVTPLQLAILLDGDVDQLAFACAAAGVGRHDPLPDDVLHRLPPVHALTLCEPPRNPEDECR